MLFPRFSIRALIALTFVAALCAYSVARAVQGEAWAVGVAVAIGAVVACLASFGVLFAASWAFGSFLALAFGGPRRPVAASGGPFSGATTGAAVNSASPFATPNRLPPQVIPDREVPLE